jgi:hypothetical protein
MITVFSSYFIFKPQLEGPEKKMPHTPAVEM